MYRISALVAGMQFVGVPLRADFTLDLDAMLAAIATHAPAVVFLAYPNNPTGNLFGVDDIEAILRAAPGLVVVDEAYQAFAGTSFLPRVAGFVLRSTAKSGMMSPVRTGQVPSASRSGQFAAMSASETSKGSSGASV